GNSTKPNRTEVTLRESAVNYHRETKVTAPLLDSTHHRVNERYGLLTTVMAYSQFCAEQKEQTTQSRRDAVGFSNERELTRQRWMDAIDDRVSSQVVERCPSPYRRWC